MSVYEWTSFNYTGTGHHDGYSVWFLPRSSSFVGGSILCDRVEQYVSGKTRGGGHLPNCLWQANKAVNTFKAAIKTVQQQRLWKHLSTWQPLAPNKEQNARLSNGGAMKSRLWLKTKVITEADNNQILFSTSSRHWIIWLLFKRKFAKPIDGEQCRDKWL